MTASARPFALDPDRLFPADPRTRDIARALYESVARLPILSPHGHTDPQWFADDDAFPDPARLFIAPDHYVHRMLYSQGVRPEDVGVPRVDGGPVETDSRKIWRRFAENFPLFRGTPSWLWLCHAFIEVFGFHERLSADNADRAYDHIAACLARPEFRPRALFERFNIEALSTTESPLDDLRHHRKIKESGWRGRVLTAFRPDPGRRSGVPRLPRQSRRAGRKSPTPTSRPGKAISPRSPSGAPISSRSAAPRPTTATRPPAPPISRPAKRRRSTTACARAARRPPTRKLFRAQMLTEMARMSLDDGLVMQIHPGSFRDHNPTIFKAFGRDKGADIPTPTDYVFALKPLLDRFGNEPSLTIILFTLDETAFSRELAPLAGHYPALRLGPPWWFLDSPEGMRRFRETVTETAGFYNTVGFNDDTRAFLSIPARHDMSRRVDCAFLARLVAEGRLERDEAFEVARDLAYGLAKAAYKL